LQTYVDSPYGFFLSQSPIYNEFKDNTNSSFTFKKSTDNFNALNAYKKETARVRREIWHAVSFWVEEGKS